MKRSRDALNERIMLLISKTDERRALYDTLAEQFNMPISLAADICAGRELIAEQNDFVAFVMLYGLAPKEVNRYFTDEEIAIFSKEKFEHTGFELPLVFKNMVQIVCRRFVKALYYLGLPKRMTIKNMILSGKINFIKEIMEREGKSIEEVIIDNRDEINARYNIDQIKSSAVFLRKYRQYFE